MTSRGKRVFISLIVFSFLSAVLALFLYGASPVPSPTASESLHKIQTLMKPGIKLTPAQAKNILKEFSKAQRTEMKAIDHRFKFEMKELLASHAARTREWETKEKNARHQFFQDHSRGPDRRGYIQDFIERRDAFYKRIAEEKAQRVHDQADRIAAVKQDQATKFKEFQKALEESQASGKLPSMELWPKPGI